MNPTQSIKQRSHRDLKNRSIPGTLANASLLPAIILPFGYEIGNVIGAWVCSVLMISISLARLGLYLRFKSIETTSPGLWLRLFTACSLSQGAIWGFLFAVVLHNFELEPISLTFILVIAGITSGTVLSLSPVRHLATTNMAFIIVPAILSSFYLEQYYTGVLLSVYLLLMSAVSLTTNKEYQASITAEIKLRKSQHDMDLLINSINGVLWEYDLTAEKHNFVSRKIESIMGYSQEQWLETEYLPLVHDEDRAMLIKAFDRQTHGSESLDLVYRLKRASGEYAWIRNIVSFEWVKGSAPIARGAFFDITQPKEAVKENEALQQKLQQSHKLQAIGQLAAGVAHEINTPIQFIGDNINFVKEGFQDILNYIDQCETLTERARESEFESGLTQSMQQLADKISISYLREELPLALNQAKDGTERVTKIVQAMKEFSHPGTKDSQLFDINRAIESTIMVCKAEWKYCATLEFTPDDSIELVECFAGELNQVILNIIVNAAHANEERWQGNAIGSITIKTQRTDNRVEIAISDTGIGMSEEVRSRIFDPFFTTKGVGKGTGQGLSMAHAVIVEQHGGELTVESVLGEGTTFLIKLPLTQQGEVAA